MCIRDRDKIENPVHKGYHLAALLTGCRPTELAMIRESDIDLDARRMIIRNAKAGNDISLPITGEIAFALAMAINAPPQTITCLLYTSDAADDLTRVDLGGRR